MQHLGVAGGLKPALVAGLLAALAPIVFALWAVDGVFRPDAFDYAQIAHELVLGNGFSSRQAIFALHLSFLQEHGLLESDWPNLHRFPLPSIGIAACFLLFGVGVVGVVAYGIAFHAATCALIFHWGRQCFGVVPATGAVLIFTLNGTMLEFACSGLAEPPVMFFFTLALYWFWRLLRGGGTRFCAGIGLALGMAGLGRTNALFVVPLFLTGMLFCSSLPWSRERWKEYVIRVALFGATLVLVLSPWLIRNWIVAGSPLFSLHSYFLLASGTTGPGGLKWDLSHHWVREFVPPLEYFRQYPELVWQKWRRNMGDFWADAPILAGTWFVPVVALLSVGLRGGRGLREVGWLLFASLVVSALLLCFTDTYYDKYYFHFMPAYALLAAFVIHRLMARVASPTLRGALVLVVLLVLTNVPGIVTSRDAVRHRHSQNPPQEQWDALEQVTDVDSVVFSDAAFHVAWNTRRKSVALHFYRYPNKSVEIAVFRLQDKYLPFDAVYLSAFFVNSAKEITAAMEKKPRFRQEFPHRRVFADGARLYYR